MAPGSTDVEITLFEPACDGTELRLVHRGLAGPMADTRTPVGGTITSRRLAVLGEERDPGPDPFADRRAPSAARLGLPMAEMTSGEAKFWTLAEPMLTQAGVSRSTMMGLPCLRVDGVFIAVAIVIRATCS